MNFVQYANYTVQKIQFLFSIMFKLFKNMIFVKYNVLTLHNSFLGAITTKSELETALKVYSVLTL